VLPDDTVVIPLAMMRYGLRKIWLPLFSGKVLHCLVVAAVFHAFTAWAGDHVSAGIKTDLGLGILIAFVILILYQAEKGRAGMRRGPEPSHAGLPAIQPPPAATEVGI
jgi:hypothetical protein